MTERDPIRQLQHLLDDPGKVWERISRIQSALGSINSPSSTTPSETPAASLPPAEEVAVLNAEDRPYDGLLQMLRDMQAHIEQRVRPLAQQSIQAEVERLRELSKQGQSALDECVAQIDQCILSCLGKIDAARQSYARLRATQRRLADLGAATEVLHLPEESADLIAARLDHLRREGKI